MELTYEDSGTERSVPVGERIELRLPENPTTGFRWQVAGLPVELQQIEDRYEGAEQPRGAGGHRTIGFEALRPGDVTLHLEKRRSWEQDPTDRFTVQLRVSPID
jgi:inhibitor of cysteine peptidase